MTLFQFGESDCDPKQENFPRQENQSISIFIKFVAAEISKNISCHQNGIRPEMAS